MSINNMSIDELAVNTIKFLAVDGVEKAKSGHPGLPMGIADVAYVLWAKYLKYNPQDPHWINRDRFVLSGGHGSMLLYTLLHLAGYDISLDDLKQFRQWESKTAGHPEHNIDLGIETTTGPLGQGITNAVGMAMAQKRLSAMFNKPEYDLIDHYIYVFAGDGDMMEGISHEACSLAGHLGLGNVVLVYDSNQISIEGNTSLAYSENVEKRFDAYNWHVQRINGHDRDAIASAIEGAQAVKDKPSIIIADTIIGKGAPNKQGKASAHGEPLGASEVFAAKDTVGWPVDQPFFVPDGVRELFAQRVSDVIPSYNAWNSQIAKYGIDFANEMKLWNEVFNKDVPAYLEDMLLDSLDCRKATATRVSSGSVIQEIAKHVPAFWGGSADLSPSNKTDVKGGGDFSKENSLGRNIHFGVREHAMASSCNGMAVYGGVVPYCSTFMVFSDYCRPAIRLSALMGQQVIYVFTHDSIFVGEDGPTHEPIEHTAALQLIPNVTVIRPADTAETIVAWMVALENTKGPTALVLSRQNLCSLAEDQKSAKGLRMGGYIIQEPAKLDAIVISNGSELELSIQAANLLAAKGYGLRVVSMPSHELFMAQDEAYRESIIPSSMTKRIAVEAASPMPWYRIVGYDGLVIGMNSFGASAPYERLAEEFGFTSEKVAARIEDYLA